jgi:hypothetical protein
MGAERRMNYEVGRAVPCAPRKLKERARLQAGAQGLTRPVWLPARPLWLLLAAVALMGCKSVLVSSYISPRVTGRVLDADTRQPISDVQVRRFNPTAQATYDEATKGGQRLDPARGVRTDQEGRFVLDAERDLTLLQQQVWFSVTVSFQHEGYQTLRTNFSLANLTTNAPAGPPVVNAGDILLHPTSP